MHRILPLLALVLLIAPGCSARVPENTQLAAAELMADSGQLGTFSTKHSPGDDGRSTNIKLAAESINQTVVQPGEEFSFNGTIGPTTERNGYQLAMIYVNGQKDEGYGGGVCQVSSTLHNAVLEAGMEVIERHDHSLPVAYVESGKEAATSYGVKDYRFINQLRHPVRIEANVTDSEVVVSIFAV